MIRAGIGAWLVARPSSNNCCFNDFIVYKWDPRDYHKNSSSQQRWAQELLAKLNLKGSEKILDIGCGDGKITAELCARVPRGLVVGIDNSKEMIDFAQELFPVCEFPNLVFRCGDAMDLNFSNEFDVVVSFACLHWIIDHRPVLKGIERSLRPSGRAVLQFGGKGNFASFLAVVEQLISDRKWSRYFEGFSFPWGFYEPGEYKTWLEGAGLRAIRVRLVKKDMAHEGENGLQGWLRSTWLPYTNAVPGALRQAFIEELTRRYIERYPIDSKGFVHVEAVRLEVLAEKNI